LGLCLISQMSWRGSDQGPPSLIDWDALGKCVTDTCKTLAPFEDQWDQTKLEKKLMDFLKKASNAAGPMEIRAQYLRNMGWEKLTTDFVEKFYEGFWNTLGDRPWVDHHDFSACISAGIKYFCPPPGLENVPDEEFMHRINVAVAYSYDYGRYYYWSREVMKNSMVDKRSIKNVRDAVDRAREDVMKECPNDIAGFLSAWIGQSVRNLSVDKGVEQNPKAHLREDNAVPLFLAMAIEGKALPFLLTQIWGVPNDLEQQISSLFTIAFAPFPAVRRGMGKGGMATPGNASQMAIQDMTQWFGPTAASVLGQGAPSLIGIPGLGGLPGLPGVPGMLGMPLQPGLRSSPY